MNSEINIIFVLMVVGLCYERKHRKKSKDACTRGILSKDNDDLDCLLDKKLALELLLILVI